MGRGLVDDAEGLVDDQLAHLAAEMVEGREQMERGGGGAGEFPAAILEAAAVELDRGMAAIDEAALAEGAAAELVEVHQDRFILEGVVLDLHDRGGRVSLA